MKITLTAPGGEPFAIADGVDRVHRSAANDGATLSQSTDVVVYTRAEWATAFPERSSSSISLSFSVSFPACASIEEAILEAHMIPAQCPKGGVLVIEHDGAIVTYAQAWKTQVSAERTGVSNVFTFDLEAVNPSAVHYLVDQSGEVITDENDNPIDA